MPSVIEGNFNFAGNVAFASVSLPSLCVSNANVAAAAAIDASKLVHLHIASGGQNNGTANTAQRKVLHIVRGATGTLKAFKCRNTTAASGSDKTTVQLKKNGSNILSAAIDLDLAASTTAQSGSFSSTSVVAGDVLEFDASITGTSTGQGLVCQLEIEETYS